MRIVSLLPSATELICAMGLHESLCGVTHECDYPSIVKSMPRVTCSRIPTTASSSEIDQLVSTNLRAGEPLYQIDQALLRELAPDVVVTQSLCDVCAIGEDDLRDAIAGLTRSPQVVSLLPQTFAEVLEQFHVLGKALACEELGWAAAARYRQRVDAVIGRGRSQQSFTAVMLEWLDPLFSAGHWNPELIAMAGGVELLGRAGQKSQRIQWSDVVLADPDYLFIACCGYSLEQTKADLQRWVTQPGFQQLKAVQNKQVWVGDGSAFFNRSGPRLVDSLEMLCHAIEPRLHPVSQGGQLLVRLERLLAW